jgi:hypothetical protein
MSLKRRGIINVGPKNHAWKGGITPENRKIRSSIEHRLWSESVFSRDSWTCMKCFEIGGKLHSHHIKNFCEFPDLRFAIDNGITLCSKHHLRFHKLFGRTGNNENQLNKYLYG